MSSITAILEPDADGSLHLPVPSEMKHGKIKVSATLTLVVDSKAVLEGATLEQERAIGALQRIAARGGLQGIDDPLDWQRQLREDRTLPGRED